MYPVFDRDNYGKWAMKMSMTLKDQGLWDAISLGGAEYAKGTAKYRLDRFALLAMYSVLPNDIIYRTFDRKSNAKELWGAIKVVCAGVDDTSAHVGQQEAVADDDGIGRTGSDPGWFVKCGDARNGDQSVRRSRREHVKF